MRHTVESTVGRGAIIKKKGGGGRDKSAFKLCAILFKAIS